MPSPKLEPVVLSDEERSVLTGWVRRRKTSQALALRARIVLLCAGGATIARVAEQAGTSRNTVSKWRSRFLSDRLEGLSDEPRPGWPRTITDEQVERVVTATLEERPGADTHWSTRSMAAATGMSQSAVSRIWRAFGLKPHTVQTWKLSTDPQFVDKVRDVVGLYLDPPENALVLAVDEKLERPELGGGPDTWKGEGLWHPRESTPLSCVNARSVWSLSCASRQVSGPGRSPVSPTSSGCTVRRCGPGSGRPRSMAGSVRGPRPAMRKGSPSWSARTASCGGRTRS